MDYQQMIPLLKERGVKKAGVFGSYARGEETPSSDLDVLVDFSRPVSLLEIIRLERELGERMGTTVDLVTEDSVSPYLQDDIMRSVKIFYEE